MLNNIKVIFIAILVIVVISENTIVNTSIINTDEVDLPILLYHNIQDTYPIEDDKLHISPDNFRKHMITLKNNGFNTITFNDYYNYVANNIDLPNNPIIITFDDGYASNYKYAYPVLKNLNMKATIFIVTGRVGQKFDIVYPHFTWEEANEMYESGLIDIQSHSNWHYDLTELDEIEIMLEMRQSRYIIEKELNKSCNVFAYPYGLFNSTIQDIAKKAGYHLMAAVGDKGVNKKSTSLMALKRLTVSGTMTSYDLIKMIADNKKLN